MTGPAPIADRPAKCIRLLLSDREGEVDEGVAGEVVVEDGVRGLEDAAAFSRSALIRAKSADADSYSLPSWRASSASVGTSSPRKALASSAGVRLSVAGCAVTPAGPAIATDTIPVKPFVGAALTLSCCPAPPAINVKLEGVADNEKSAAGVVPAPSPVATCDPPPQDTSPRQSRELKQAEAFEKTLISRLRS